MKAFCTLCDCLFVLFFGTVGIAWILFEIVVVPLAILSSKEVQQLLQNTSLVNVTSSLIQNVTSTFVNKP